MKKVILILLFLIPVAVTEAPAQKKKSERAYASFNAGEYYNAIDQFKSAYSKSKKSDKATRTELVFMIGESYRLVNDPKNAETWYKLAVKSSFSKPEAQFRLAEAIKKNGKPQQAIEEFRKYKQITPSDSRADQEIRACELAIEWMKNPEAYRVEELKDINSREGDFSPAYARQDDGLLYLHHRETMQPEIRLMGQPGKVLPIFLRQGSIKNQSGAPPSLYRG
jgi:peptidoglycan-associated lipoprotein